MNLHKTKIEWATHTWNPVTGCRHGCPYCYARTIAHRFEPKATERPEDATSFAERPDAPGCYEIHHTTKLEDGGAFTRVCQYPVGFAPALYEYTLDYPEKRLTPARIFVSSMGDLFGEWVPEEWIERVFDACRKAPQHVYMFLTKNPARYQQLAEAGKLPRGDNFWYGTTITRNFDVTRALDLPKGTHRFLSIEPLEEPVDLDLVPAVFDWLILGAMSGPGKNRHKPKREWVQAITEYAEEHGTPLFMKDSLLPIWGDGLIQELPEEMKQEKPGPAPIPRCRSCESCTTKEQGARGTACYCEIGWEAAGYDDRGARHIPGRYTRSSPPWCPRREEATT